MMLDKKPPFLRSLLILISLSLLTGCANDTASNIPVSISQSKPAPVEEEISEPALPAAAIYVAHANNAILTCQRLEGHPLTSTTLNGILGMTRWKNKLIISNATKQNTHHQPYLEALTIDLKHNKVSTALELFQNGQLLAHEDDRYIYPEADQDGRLYFAHTKGFSFYKDKELTTAGNIKGGPFQLIISPSGTTGYAVKNKRLEQLQLKNGRLTSTKDLSKTVTETFNELNTLALGRDNNKLIYVTGPLKNKSSDSYKLGIYSQEFKSVKLTSTDKVDKMSSEQLPPFAQLAITQKYVLSWKFSFQPKIPAQFYLWTLEGTFLGNIKADKVLGTGWQPVAVTNWDNKTLLMVGAKIIKQEKKTVGHGKGAHTIDSYIWEYGFFKIDVT